LNNHLPVKWKPARAIHTSLRGEVIIALRDGSVIAHAQVLVINGRDLNARSVKKITVPRQFWEYATSDFDFRLDWIHESGSVSPPASFNYTTKKQIWRVEGLEFKTHDGAPAEFLGQNRLGKPAVTKAHLLEWLCEFPDEVRKPEPEWHNEAKEAFPLHRVARKALRAALMGCGKTGLRGRPPCLSGSEKTAN
jgi:hypothetical protein